MWEVYFYKELSFVRLYWVDYVYACIWVCYTSRASYIGVLSRYLSLCWDFLLQGFASRSFLVFLKYFFLIFSFISARLMVPNPIFPSTRDFPSLTAFRLFLNSPGEGVAPSPTPLLNRYWKGSFHVALDYVSPNLLTFFNAKFNSYILVPNSYCFYRGLLFFFIVSFYSLRGGLSLSSDLQDYTQYSGRSKPCRSLNGLHF